MNQRQQLQLRLINLMKTLENADDAAMGMYIYSALGRQMLLMIADDQDSDDKEVIGSVQAAVLKLKELHDKYKDYKANHVASTKSMKPMPVN